MTDAETRPRRTFAEEIEVAGHQPVTRVKEHVAEGRARKLRIKAPDGDMVVEMPLNVGVVAGGVVTLAAPGPGGGRQAGRARDAGPDQSRAGRRRAGRPEPEETPPT